VAFKRNLLAKLPWWTQLLFDKHTCTREAQSSLVPVRGVFGGVLGRVLAAFSACFVLLSEAYSTDNLTEPLANYTRENQPCAPQKCDEWRECLEKKSPAWVAISKSTGRHTERQQKENDDKKVLSVFGQSFF